MSPSVSLEWPLTGSPIIIPRGVSESARAGVGWSGEGEDGMTGGNGGEGVAGGCVRVLGRSPFDPALERARAQAAASIRVQVQVQLTSRSLPGAVLKKA